MEPAGMEFYIFLQSDMRFRYFGVLFYAAMPRFLGVNVYVICPD